MLSERISQKWTIAFIKKFFGNLNIWFFPQVSYAIGVAEPLSVTVMDYGTSNKTNEELTDIVKKNFDLRPGICIDILCCVFFSSINLFLLWKKGLIIVKLRFFQAASSRTSTWRPPSSSRWEKTILTFEIPKYEHIFFVFLMQTSTYGHFGREIFTWEQPKQLKL